MVSSLNTQTSAREMGYNVVEHIGGRVQANAGGAVVNVKLGKIPAGAILIGVATRIATAYTGGTPALTVGTLGDAGLDNVVLTIAEAQGGEFLQPIAGQGGPLAADTEFWAALAGGATAGDGVVLILFARGQLP